MLPRAIAYADDHEVAPHVHLTFDNPSNNFLMKAEGVDHAAFTLDYIDEVGTRSGVTNANANMEEKIYAGTCSQEVCVPHKVKEGSFSFEGIYDDMRTYNADILFRFIDGIFWTYDVSKWSTKTVELGKKYTAPQNSSVSVTFTKLPENPGSLSIEEVALTDEQVKSVGALSNIAYDITSDMKDGEFEYDLSLPIPDALIGKDVEVRFAESVDTLSTAEIVTELVQKDSNKVAIKDLSHFTVFVITGVNHPSASNMIDDGDANFSTNVPWNNYAAGINGDVKYKSNVAGNWARWTFTDAQVPVSGQTYAISTHWVVWNDHVVNATYRLYDQDGTLISVLGSVDQNKMADGSSAPNGTLSGWYVFPGAQQ